MSDNMNDNRSQRSSLGLRELAEDVQDLGQVGINIVGDLLQLAGAIITLPFQLLPRDTRTHLKGAAREAGMAAQSVFEETVNAVNAGVQKVNSGLRGVATDQTQSDADDDPIIIEETTVQPHSEATPEPRRQPMEPNLES